MAPALDSKVAHLLDTTARHPTSDDEDDLIAELEDEDDGAFSALRERRLEQLHAELSRAKMMRNTSHGTYTELHDEKELLNITTTTKLCVVHFFKPDFPRCRFMTEKLRALAPKHFDTRFVGIDVEQAPFLVVKLGVQVLPCVLGFVDGVSVDRIVGFEGIGYKADSFAASELEARLLGSGVLVRAKMTKEDDRRREGGRERVREVDDEDGDDWD
ncbi:hypothetical protein LTR08_006066 [Meristemomyces frigidus]|nr:hypothetical protein LTR08_006066 [Meristemomyces frigidus]